LGLETKHYELLKQYGKGGTLLSLGYPDLLVKKDDLGVEAMVRPDSKDIGKWHNWPFDIYESKDVFQKLGYASYFVDLLPSRGCERVLDLNQPIEWAAQDMLEQFDVVLDPGTLEHVFNIGQAFKNVLALLKPGGVVIHLNPTNQINHGFWSISPTAYWDFYTQNGCGIEEISTISGPVLNRVYQRLPLTPEGPITRWQVAVEMSVMCVAKKPLEGKATLWPIQTKYRNSAIMKEKEEAKLLEKDKK